MINLILPLISSWLAGRQRVNDKKLDLKLADLENKADLLRSKEQYNNDWEIRSLTHSPTFLRSASFTLFSLPIVITVISPEHGAEVWTNLDVVPDWFKAVYLSMVGGIWGIVELKNAGIIKR